MQIMKRSFILCLSLLACSFLFGQSQNVDAVIKMNKETHDFGKIKQSVPVRYVFEIKNISSTPVVVSNAWGSCGCVIPEKPEQPIEPGKTTALKVTFTAPAVGKFNKAIYINIAGVDQPKVLEITGEVLSPEDY